MTVLRSELHCIRTGWFAHSLVHRANRFCDLRILVRSMDCQYRRADRHGEAQLWWRVKASVVLDHELVDDRLEPISPYSAEDRERRSRIEPDGEPARSWGERGAGP